MPHHTLLGMFDPHLPNNDPSQVQMALENVLNEMENDTRYSHNPGIEYRIERLEAGFMLLVARLTQHGVG